MAPEEPLITEEARALIGVESTLHLGQVTLRDIQRYAMAVGDLNPLYFDEEYARRSAYGGIIAPPNFLSAVMGWQAGPPESQLALDGRPERPELNLNLPGLERVMGAGQELELLLPVRPGDSFSRLTKITDISQRQGRSGPFLLVNTEEQYINQKGEVALVCRASYIIR